jgi:large subunit ribosomal protein L16
MYKPKKRKFKKHHLYKTGKTINKKNHLVFGDYGLMSEEFSLLSDSQIEVIVMTFSRSLQRDGQTFIRIFPDRPMTSKPAETRMGKGKGALDHWIAVVKPGRILFEIAGVSEERAREALRRASHKLPIKTKFVARRELSG